ncbi:MAG: RagB/SusD family nutrient uptake outer membrane protein [Bacteroidetes bacterium]|nr:RagB/SusD family nutrient uptake outer membrane protein [Bacteroidota bacterium]
MKRFLLYITGAVLILTTGASCKKYLSLQPQDGIIRQEYWQTKEQVLSAVTGCYASLLGDPTGSDRPLSEYLFMWGELRADLVSPGLGASQAEQDIMNVNTLATNAMVKWSSVYRTINYCNTVIEFAPDVLSKDNTFTQAQLNNYLAEVRALRGLMYFYLVRSFRDVPLKLNATSSDTDLDQLAKTSGDSVMAQVVKDLAFADSNAVITYGNQASDKGRINKYTVKAIEADVFLWLERYQDCVNACDFIIQSGKFGLIAGDNGWFNTLYYKGNSNEAIFEFQYDVQKLNSFYNIFLTSRPRYLASPYVMEDLYTIDLVNDQNKDIRGDGAAVRTSDNAIWKYVGVTYNLARTTDASYAHWFVYRYAEILLSKAETLNQLGRGQEALDIVNVIRNRAHALSGTDTHPDVSDPVALGDYILAERGRELAFEGKRWYDMLRNAKRNKYSRLDLLLSMVARSVPAQLQQSAINKFRNPDCHYFPIYYYEIQTDPNLVQNPFYK